MKSTKTAMVCGGCEHKFVVKGVPTNAQLERGAVECPRCECTDVETQESYNRYRERVLARNKELYT